VDGRDAQIKVAGTGYDSGTIVLDKRNPGSESLSKRSAPAVDLWSQTLRAAVLISELPLFWALETGIGELAFISARTHPKRHSKNMNPVE
jgi:hypothetical protein